MIEEDYKNCKEVLMHVAKDYLKDDNINSVGIACKIKRKEDRQLHTLSIRFTVDVDLSPEAARIYSTLIPPFLTYENLRVPTDVVQRKYCIHKDIEHDSPEEPISDPERLKFQEVIQPGLSLSSIHREKQVGTIGAIVFDEDSGDAFALSNHHVMVKDSANRHDRILQPARAFDKNIDKTTFGKLKFGYLGIDGDFAIASIENRQPKRTIFGLGVVPDEAIDPKEGDRVVKSGVGSNNTHGIVSCTDQIIQHPITSDLIRGFEIRRDPEIENIGDEVSVPKDSGSLIMLKTPEGQLTNKCLGLLFGGEASDLFPEFSVACYMTSVLENLNMRLTKEKQ